jgi:hypothetical protein
MDDEAAFTLASAGLPVAANTGAQGSCRAGTLAKIRRRQTFSRSARRGSGHGSPYGPASSAFAANHRGTPGDRSAASPRRRPAAFDSDQGVCFPDVVDLRACRWQVAMSTICWTVIHNAVASLARVATTATRPVRHALGHVLHRTLHQTSTHTWTQVVCKAMPAAVLSGGLLIPAPGNPPRPPPAPPVVAGLSAPAWPDHGLLALPVHTTILPPEADTAPTPPIAVPEPRSVLLLVTAVAALLIIRRMRRCRPTPPGSQLLQAASQDRTRAT